MTRSQLITKVANETNLSCSEVEKVMDGIFGTIGDVLKSGDKVTIAGFGRFEMRERQTKNFTNPKTAMDTARVLVDALRGDHDISEMELVDVAALHRDAAAGK